MGRRAACKCQWCGTFSQSACRPNSVASFFGYSAHLHTHIYTHKLSHTHTVAAAHSSSAPSVRDLISSDEENLVGQVNQVSCNVRSHTHAHTDEQRAPPAFVCVYFFDKYARALKQVLVIQNETALSSARRARTLTNGRIRLHTHAHTHGHGDTRTCTPSSRTNWVNAMHAHACARGRVHTHSNARVAATRIAVTRVRQRIAVIFQGNAATGSRGRRCRGYRITLGNAPRRRSDMILLHHRSGTRLQS